MKSAYSWGMGNFSSIVLMRMTRVHALGASKSGTSWYFILFRMRRNNVL